MSLGDGSLSYTSKNDSKLLKAGWLHYVNNGNSTIALSESDNYITLLAAAPNLFHGEWTISINGQRAWGIESYGEVNSDYHDVYMSVRPVFYLTSDVKSSKGSGEYNDPYIL